MDSSIKARDAFAAQGKTAAYKQAVEYIKFKKEHLLMPDLDSIELTNACNLNCPNCGSTTAKFHKGFMSDEVFDLALKLSNPAKYMAIHGAGEPLLHPKFLQYLEKLVEIDKDTIVSTNGILLDDAMQREIFSLMGRLSKGTFLVSFHTRKSVENWFHCLDIAAQYPNIRFVAQLIDHNKEDAYRWLRELGIAEPQNHPNIQHITSHSWAGNVPGRAATYKKAEVRNRIRNCFFLRNRLFQVRWDGTVMVCCLDMECTQKSGSIFDLERIEVNRDGYELCNHCDPDWISNFQ